MIDFLDKGWMELKGTFKLVYVSLLTALGIVLHIVEYNIPIPVSFPGAKLGLANIASLLTIVIYGPATGIVVSVLRAILGAFLTGGIASLPYSLSGAVLSTVVMWLSIIVLRDRLSLIGVSVIGSAAHLIAQLLVASIILDNFRIFAYMPILLMLGTVTGYFNGMVANISVKILKYNLNRQKKIRGNTK